MQTEPHQRRRGPDDLRSFGFNETREDALRLSVGAGRICLDRPAVLENSDALVASCSAGNGAVAEKSEVASGCGCRETFKVKPRPLSDRGEGTSR